MADYASSSALNWSLLKHLQKSERAYVHAMTAVQPETPAMRLGTLIHMAVLEPGRWSREVVSYDGERRGAAWQKFRDEHVEAGRTVTTGAEYATAQAAALAVRNHPTAAPLLRRAWEREVELYGEVDSTDCKGKLDAIGEGILLDLKSTSGNVQPRVWARTAHQYSYHGQVAFYRELALTLNRPVDRCYLIAVQTVAPYEVCVYRVSDDVLELGKALVMDLLGRRRDLHARGLETARHEYEAEVELTFPSWAYGTEGDALEGMEP